MWRLPAWYRLTEPLPRTRKRLAAPLLVFILGMMPSLSWCSRWRNLSALLDLKSPSCCLLLLAGHDFVLLLRGQDHHHLAPFELGPLLHDSHRREVGLDSLQELHSELLVGHLATTESKRDLGLVPFGQESREV